MKLLKNYRLTSIAVALISLVVIQTAITGEDTVVSGAIIQAGWCTQGDYICLLKVYVSFSLIIIFVAFLLDLLIGGG